MTYQLVDNRELITKFGKNDSDTGLTEVQIAVLSNRINYLTEHFKTNPKDHHGRRGLLKLVGRRRRLLRYLSGRSIEKYRKLIAELGLRR